MLSEVKKKLRTTPVGAAVRSARRRYRRLPSQQARALDSTREQWIAKGRPLPAPPELKMAEVVSYAQRFRPRVFIETGTYYGSTLDALKPHVAKAWSIELDPVLASKARIRFAADAHVEILEGDSGVLLPQLLEGLYEPALFWLDGHWSMFETAKGELETPIHAELEAVLAHAVEDHIVLIDDARCFGEGDYPTIDEVRDLVAKHRPDWLFEVDLDIIRTHRRDLD